VINGSLVSTVSVDEVAEEYLDVRLTAIRYCVTWLAGGVTGNEKSPVEFGVTVTGEMKLPEVPTRDSSFTGVPEIQGLTLPLKVTAALTAGTSVSAVKLRTETFLRTTIFLVLEAAAASLDVLGAYARYE
jgi:hypothetical protein